ncbi:hypothetical protein C8A01DRAFT_31275 [Parachaetomium inaequale]|uniref:Uncharacterized protein n=1 Tax=Parachaetomium inaequale TaxID=2588326 RepID=A0AAN6PPB0_9PEZI|nr:hypothetical protein C8A01DRAFT_31275 [Parachaetomium inaequale]
MAEERAESERKSREEAVLAAVRARDAEHRDAPWKSARRQYRERRRASRGQQQQQPTSKTQILRATAAAAANRRFEEARLESALAEESRLRAAWEAAAAAVAAQKAAVEFAIAEETRLNGLLLVRGRARLLPPSSPKAHWPRWRAAKKVVRFALPDDPEPSLEGRGRVEAEVAQEPAKGEHIIVPPGPETVTQESLADEPIPEAEQGEAKAGADDITEEPETPLEGKVKVDEDIVEEPEASLERKVKADAEIAEELEFPLETKVKADQQIAEEPESSLETKVKVDHQVAEELESSLERRVKDDQIADEPEASLERTATEDAIMAEPDPKASSEDEAMVEAADYTPAKSETEPSYEGEETMDAEQVAAEPIPEVEQGEEMAEATLAEAPETAEPIGLAQEPEKAEFTTSLADAPMSEPSYEGEDEVMGEHSDEPEFTDDDQMLIDEPQPFDEQEAAAQMMAEQERLAAAIEEQARADGHANQLAELQRAEAQRSADEDHALRLLLQDAVAQHDREQAEAAERAQQEEQRALEAEMVARLQAEEEQARLAAQAAAEPAHAEEVSMLDAVTPVPDAEMPQSVGADEDMSLTEEELQYLHTHHDSFTMDEQEELYEVSLFGDYEWEDALDTASQGTQATDPPAATCVPLLILPTTVDLTLPTTTPTPTPTTPAHADHTPPTGGQAGPTFAFGQAVHQTTPEAVVPPVSSFTFGVDTPAAAAAPTGLQEAEAADAEPAPAGEAEPRLAVPADPAARRILPARGVRRRLQARLGAAQELRETQAVVPETETGVFGGEINVDLDDELDPELLAELAQAEADWDAEEDAKAVRAAAAQALVEAEEEDAADPKGKGKARSKSKAEARAEARAQIALELEQQEETQRQFAAQYEADLSSRFGLGTIFREPLPDEEALFDPRSKAAKAVADGALAMSMAAEEAQRSANQWEPEPEDEVIWDDTDSDVSEEE